MQKWEYKYVHTVYDTIQFIDGVKFKNLPAGTPDKIVEALKGFGNQGWELVATAPYGVAANMLYFKRPTL